MKKVLVIHGGAGVIPKSFPPEKVNAYLQSLAQVLEHGFSVLNQGGSALDAVTSAVLQFECDPLFNAGKGAVYTTEATHELDASIMDGRTREFGAVCTVRHVKHPVTLARIVMEQSDHFMLSGSGAESFAKRHGVEMVDNSYFDNEYRFRQLEKAREQNIVARDHDIDSVKPMGTVGAVALDGNGNLAAATSTGGTTNKVCGRVGDTPILGAGTYANNDSCAVSCTGFGEEFIKNMVAYDIHARMAYQGLSLKEATEKVVFEQLDKGMGGLIAVDRYGNFAQPFNTPGMFRGVQTDTTPPRTAIWE